MKKYALYLMPVLALGMLASCQEEDPFKGIAQQNPQEEMIKAETLAPTTGSGIAGEAIDLNSYKDQMIPVLVAPATPLPNGGVYSYTMQMASKEDFSDAQDIDVIDGQVSANEWSNAFRAVLGRSPKAKTNYVRFIGYITTGDNVYRIGGPDTYFANKSMTVTPIDLGVKIESAYYLIGTCNDWSGDVLADWQFSHSDADVYDDPVFTIDVTISEEQAAGGWWWKIIPQSNIDAGDVWQAGVLGVVTDGDTALSGYLAAKTDEKECGAGCVMEAGKFKLTINMEDGTYEFVNNSNLYAVGDGSGWGFDDYKCQKLFAWDDGYVGFTYIQSQVKFTDAPDWNHGNYGLGAEPGTLLAGSNDNIPVEGPGLYYAKVNLGAMTYELTNISAIGMIGGFNNWGADEALTPSEDFLVWTGTLTLSEGSEWKFRMNGGWDINLGGTTDNLMLNGDNLWCDAGTYTVTLDLRTLPLTCTIK